MHTEDVEVLVVGCGPVGALTANLLGTRGVRTLVVESSTAPHGQPRAFSCDDEALRIYQQAGLRDEVVADMHIPSVAEYVNAKGEVFARIALDEIDFGLGARPLYFFDQPRLEATLRAGLDRFAHVTLRTGVTMAAMSQGASNVTAVLRDRETGAETRVRARYVLGCDGARSTTRRAVGTPLSGSSYAEQWLAVSGTVPPDAVRVARTRFVCDWRRPAFVSPGAHGTYRLEFMLHDGEDPATMDVAALVAPYVDPDRFTVTRSSGYTFHQLVAARWRAGRVFLLGDAAHQMPPFLGQGLCSGLRDAANLVWKLALVLAGDADEGLLDSYEAERRPHTEEMAATSVRMGHVFLVRNRFAAAARDLVLTAVQRVPRVRRFISHFEFKPLPAHREGLMAGGRGEGVLGTMFPQPTIAGRPLDDLLGPGFAVLGPDVTAGTVKSWAGPPATFHRVSPAPTRSDEVAELVDESLAAWFARHRVGMVVLRPDRFVYATSVSDVSVPLITCSHRPSEASRHGHPAQG
ncbi:bifunctional 3-(3-hydroxy-phenyl)propionate/3-hydroxycinnamic acid hydroxylase [Actinophytocola glycyrrhizae]|uniref:Bifunctional 3-(3-hydroxy-phenyl)propionate/3-hydroxycinnamic acid hydroxylase n=1 Tax=Actinophytocola glycyrrhizae TaxID=2044873 RepID=A0ABV9RXB1_9PSEU